MTDLATASGPRPAMRRLDVGSSAYRTRVARRNRAETRFRFYGLSAIFLAALFLVLLLTDIVLKALPAFTRSTLLLDVPVTAEAIDPKAPAAGDFDAAVRDGLRALFPAMKSRNEKKVLSAVLSPGAADELRRRVLADPSLIGSTVKVPVLLASDADLYLKGTTARSRIDEGTSAAAPSDVAGTVTIDVEVSAIAHEVEVIKDIAAGRAAALSREVSRAETLARGAAADLTAAEASLAAAKASSAADTSAPEAAVIKAKEAKASLDKQVAALRAEVSALQAAATASAGAQQLDSAMPSLILALNGGYVKANTIAAGRIEGEVLVPLASKDPAPSGSWRMIVVETPEASRKIDDREIAVLESLKEKGAVERKLNLAFFTTGDSREPEVAGILGALMGSAFTMLVTLALTLPIGVAAAVYLEEFAPKNRLTHFIEVNINNLAAVPSIVFGLLGLAVFLNFFGMPRSSPLVGGLVLALLVLPTIIIASRAALKAVPPSIREAALGVGASHQQAVFHHVLPVAMPGILTGTIIGMAHALGETAPLLMIGMIAFIVDVPARLTDAATVLPVQIYLWSDLPEIGFQSKTAAAIIVLLLFLFVMNGLAIWLRRKFEQRW